MQVARQIAALPFRHEDDGTVRVLLVTSREAKRWIIPKGWPWPGCDDWLGAAHEAREEAGIIGRMAPTALGSFVYEKRRSTSIIPVRVTVYLLEVTDMLDDWPESTRGSAPGSRRPRRRKRWTCRG